MSIRFDVFSIFPQILKPYFDESILKRAIEHSLIDVHLHDIRAWTTDRHHTTDDTPFGGRGGMIMKPEPVFSAVEDILGRPPTCPLILMTPQGRLFNQKIAAELSSYPHLAFLCGRYEGVDERIREHLVSDEISIGDYVLTGGEIPAIVVIDAITRLIPGVLGDPDGALDDSHATGLLEYPHYTRPPEYRGWKVPDILLSGNHPEIARWRRQQALIRTLQRRPDLLEKADLSQTDKDFLKSIEDQSSDRDSNKA